jgi:hypothetical protein
LLCKPFELRYELRDWCLARLKQLKDPIYLEEHRLKAEEEKRLTRRPKNRGGVRHPGLENITMLDRKR